MLLSRHHCIQLLRTWLTLYLIISDMLPYFCPLIDNIPWAPPRWSKRECYTVVKNTSGSHDKAQVARTSEDDDSIVFVIVEQTNFACASLDVWSHLV